MLRKTISLTFLVTVLSVIVGCSGADSSADGSAGRNVPNEPIARVVHDFWEAVRTGDVQAATDLLTPLAIKCISDNDYAFAPPASNTARFQVGRSEQIERDKAIVESIWTDVDADGQPQDEKITLALRLVGGKWRISGMAADLGPNQPPMVMNLEDPAEFFGPQKPSRPRQIDAVERQADQGASDPFQQPLTR